MSAENKALIRRFYEEVFSEGRFSTIDELIAQDAVEHEPVPGATGNVRADLKAWLTQLRAAFSEMHLSVEDLLAEDDRVAVRCTLTGVHSGDLMSIPPTGRSVAVTVLDIVRISGGLIVEHWGVTDTAGMLGQLGVGPGV